MKLGAFSVSLAVKDINKSFEFYKKLGFVPFGGDINQNWIILKNEETVIGLFQGMFEKNIITFNPGWDSNAENLQTFEDVREIENKLVKQGVKIIESAKGESGPAYITLEDPDGNAILIDQHR